MFILYSHNVLSVQLCRIGSFSYRMFPKLMVWPIWPWLVHFISLFKGCLIWCLGAEGGAGLMGGQYKRENKASLFLSWDNSPRFCTHSLNLVGSIPDTWGDHAGPSQHVFAIGNGESGDKKAGWTCTEQLKGWKTISESKEWAQTLVHFGAVTITFKLPKENY